MEVFWKHGFEGASLNELTEAMGINPPSLYAAFGDKEHLFLEAVERYQSRHGEACPYADERTARGSVERLLTYTATEFSRPCNPRGCLMVMAASTSSTSSAALQSALAQRRDAAKTRLKARIDQGLKEGELPPGTNTAALADFYSTVLAGMSLQARDGATRKSLMATVAAAMRAWPGPAADAASPQNKRERRPGARREAAPTVS
jgi:TetR/AcrR family transcriptional regulator, copper-responsive repressor